MLFFFHFLLFLLAISWHFFCFLYFRYNFWKNRRYGFKFWQCLWLIMFFKNWNKIFKNDKNAIVLRDYRISLLFKQRFFLYVLGHIFAKKHLFGLKFWQMVKSGEFYAIMRKNYRYKKNHYCFIELLIFYCFPLFCNVLILYNSKITKSFSLKIRI